LNYQNHLFATSTAYAAIILLLIWRGMNFNYWILWGIIPMLFFSILPDVDHPVSKVKFLITGSVLLPTLYFVIKKNYLNTIISLIVLIVLWVMPTIKGIRHRQFFHNPIAGIFMALPMFYFGWRYYVIAFLSYFSHISFDYLSRNVGPRDRSA
jgi:hypothetical protein